MKSLKLFMAVFFGAGLVIVAGSFIGGAIAHRSGFLLGAGLGGYLGIHLSVAFAKRQGWIAKAQVWPAMIGGVVVYGTTEVFQKWVTASAAHSFGAMALVALGAVAGARVKRKNGPDQAS